MSISALSLAMLLCAGGALAGSLPASGASSKQQPMPLFLAARASDAEDAGDMRRAAQRKLKVRAMTVSSGNLKWKPYRPKPETSEVAEAKAEPADRGSSIRITRQEDSEDSQVEQVTYNEPSRQRTQQATRIAADDSQQAPRRAVRPSRAKLRGAILQVQAEEPEDSAPAESGLDTFDDFGLEPSSETNMPAEESPLDEGYPGESSAPSERSAPGADQPRTLQGEGGPFGDEDVSNADQPFATPGTPEPGGCTDKDRDSCERALRYLRETTLDKLNINIAVSGQEGVDFPCECLLSGTYNGRNWECTTFTWKASALCHKPLYFEEVALERYGHSLNPLIQPLWSGVHFFLSVPMLPYMMGMDSPWECKYALGYYRPGSCAPYMVPPFPWSVRGAVLETAVIVGGIAIIP